MIVLHHSRFRILYQHRTGKAITLCTMLTLNVLYRALRLVQTPPLLTNPPHFCVRTARSTRWTFRCQVPLDGTQACMLSLPRTFPLYSTLYCSVADWMTVQSKCGVSFNNTVPVGLLFDSNNPAASNGTSYNVTAYALTQSWLPTPC